MRTEIDAASVERFLERLAPTSEQRAVVLEATSVRRGAGFRAGVQAGGAMLPVQPEDLIFGDPALEHEWRALTHRVG